MLADSPYEYRKYPDILDYLSEVPASFDDSIILYAKVSEYVVVAKRKENLVYRQNEYLGRTEIKCGSLLSW